MLVSPGHSKEGCDPPGESKVQRSPQGQKGGVPAGSRRAPGMRLGPGSCPQESYPSRGSGQGGNPHEDREGRAVRAHEFVRFHGCAEAPYYKRPSQVGVVYETLWRRIQNDNLK